MSARLKHPAVTLHSFVKTVQRETSRREKKQRSDANVPSLFLPSQSSGESEAEKFNENKQLNLVIYSASREGFTLSRKQSRIFAVVWRLSRNTLDVASLSFAWSCQVIISG